MGIMKNCKKLLSVIVTLLLAASLLTSSAFAISGEAFIATPGEVNLRDSGSFNSNVIDAAPQGATVYVLGDAGYGWYKVSYNGKTGYMMAKYLKFTAYMHNGTARVFNANGGSYVNVRGRASLSANVIGTVPVGTTVKVLEKTTDWTKVEVNGKTGYISTWFLKF